MADSSCIKTQVSSMLGMKFGSFNASLKNMNNVYIQGPESSTEWSEQHNGSYKKKYLNNNYKEVAETFLTKTDTEVAYTIFDIENKRAYCTGLQNKNNASDKFTRIDFWNNGFRYSIVDSNGNGIIDEDDTLLSDTNNDQKKLKNILG